MTIDPATKLITKADPNMIALIALVWIQVIFVTMVYGPIAVFLVEYFRAKVMTVVIGTLFLKEPKNVKIWEEVGGEDEQRAMPAAAPAD